MLQDAVTVNLFLLEAIRPARQIRVMGEKLLLHLSSGLSTEYSTAFATPAFEMGNHEACHIGGAGVDTAFGHRD